MAAKTLHCLTRNAATHQEIVSAGAIQPLVELLLLRPDAVYALYNLMLHTTASPKELGAYALAIAEAGGIAALEEIENDESADATMKTFASHTLKAVCRTPLPIEVSSLETWLADSDELLRKINDEPVGKPLAKELKAWLEEKAEEAIVDVISEAGQMPLKTLCNQFKERVGPTKEAQRAFMGKVSAIATRREVGKGGKMVTYVVLKAETIDKYGLALEEEAAKRGASSK